MANTLKQVLVILTTDTMGRWAVTSAAVIIAPFVHSILNPPLSNSTTLQSTLARYWWSTRGGLGARWSGLSNWTLGCSPYWGSECWTWFVVTNSDVGTGVKFLLRSTAETSFSSHWVSAPAVACMVLPLEDTLGALHILR